MKEKTKFNKKTKQNKKNNFPKNFLMKFESNQDIVDRIALLE